MLEKKSYSSSDQCLKDKVLPNSMEAEQSILGALMLDNDCWDSISESIVAEDFFIRSHQLILSEMKALLVSGRPIDLITLSESLEKNGRLNLVGGFAYLAELTKNTLSTANIDTYATIVREKAMLRDMILVSKQISDICYSPQGRSSTEILSFIESRILKVSESRSSTDGGPKDIQDILDTVISRIESLMSSSSNGITGIDTGYQDLNRKTAGLQRSDLVVIAARPSMGKTALAMNLCENAAMMYDKPVLIFSLEMPSEQIVTRMLASLSRVDQTKIRVGQLSDEDWARIYSSMNVLAKRNNIYIDDSSSLTPAEIRLRARRIFRERGGLSMIMIDYLQLMRVPGLSENRNLEVAEASRSLKSLAKELDIPVVALSQLNRSLEQRGDKRPVNSDLRESGSIEQDADKLKSPQKPKQGSMKRFIGTC